MKRIFQEHKRVCLITGIVLAVIVLAVYLYAFFRPGVWHQNTFLYKQKDGSFRGSGFYASYEMHITRTDTKADISFAVNDTINEYEIVQNEEAPEVEIYQNGKVVFQGRMLEAGDTYLGMDENGDWISGPLIIVETGAPSEAELFPSYGQLYAWAIAEKYDIHGNIVILVCILILTAILIIDIVFPDFYFLLHYSLAVKGGAEPSDWYRTWQRIGQVIMGIIIIICMMLSFKNP